jgi:hypothetical protein
MLILLLVSSSFKKKHGHFAKASNESGYGHAALYQLDM